MDADLAAPFALSEILLLPVRGSHALCHRKPRLVAGQAEIELLLPLVSLACRTAAYSEPQRGILQAAGDALRAIYDRRQIEQKDHRPRQCCGRLI
jgi:hypothetical protein